MRFAIVSLVLAASATPQEQRPFDPFRDIVVRGAVTYAAEEIVNQLAFDETAWKAMRSPSPRSAAHVLAERVRDGYRRGGFMDADVMIAHEDGRIVLRVTEGPCVRCGTVRVTGNRSVDASVVVDALVQPEKQWDGSRQWNGWTAGGVARCDEATRAQAWRRVVARYEAAGVGGTRGHVGFVRSDEAVDLHVQIEDEGDEVRIGRVVLAAFKFSQSFGDAWPATVLRAMPDLVGGEHRQAALGRLHRLSGDEATGPIGLTITAVVFRKLGSEQHANYHSKAALARCDFDHTFADLLTLAPEGTAMRTWLLGLGRHWRDHTDAVRPLDGSEPDELAALRTGLRVVWDAGLGSYVRQAVESARPRKD